MILRRVGSKIPYDQIMDHMFLSSEGDFAFVFNEGETSNVIRMNVTDSHVTWSEFVDETDYTPFKSNKNKVRFHLSPDRKRCIMSASNHCTRDSPCYGSLHQISFLEVHPKKGFSSEKSCKWRLHLPFTFRLFDWQMGPDESTVYLLMLSYLSESEILANFEVMHTEVFNGILCHEDQFVTRPGSLVVYSCNIWANLVRNPKFKTVMTSGGSTHDGRFVFQAVFVPRRLVRKERSVSVSMKNRTAGFINS